MRRTQSDTPGDTIRERNAIEEAECCDAEDIPVLGCQGLEEATSPTTKESHWRPCSG